MPGNSDSNGPDVAGRRRLRIGWLLMLAVAAATVAVGVAASGLIDPGGLTPDEQLLLGSCSELSELAWAEALARRWPDDPACAGNYVAVFLSRQAALGGPTDSDRQAYRQRCAVLLRDAAEAEPGNAFYPATLSGLLVEESCRIEELEGDVPVPGVLAAEAECSLPRDRLTVVDVDGFRRATSLMRRAAAGETLTCHTDEIARRRARIVLRSGGRDARLRASRIRLSRLPLPTRLLRRATRAMCLRALDLGRRGRLEQARALLVDLERVCLLLGREARAFPEILTAYELRISVLKYRCLVEREAGRVAHARRTAELLADERRAYQDAALTGPAEPSSRSIDENGDPQFVWPRRALVAGAVCGGAGISILLLGGVGRTTGHRVRCRAAGVCLLVLLGCGAGLWGLSRVGSGEPLAADRAWLESDELGADRLDRLRDRYRRHHADLPPARAGARR